MGMYRVEWPCCGDVTETEAWQPESCPFCAPTPTVQAVSDMRDADMPKGGAASKLIFDLASEVESLRADAARYRWLRRKDKSIKELESDLEAVRGDCEEYLDAAIDAMSKPAQGDAVEEK